MIRRLCCASALALALVAVSVPGAQAATSAPNWASKFCVALKKWQKSVKSESQKEQDVLDLTAGSDLAALRDEFVKFLAKDVRATNAAIKSIDRLGAPDVTDGKKIQDKVIAGFQSTSDVFAGAQQDAAALSTTDASSFVADATKISSNLGSASDGFTQAFTEVQSLDTDNSLAKALSKARACKALG